MIDAAQTYKQVLAMLTKMGYVPRDADGSDFHRPGSPIRYKVGTSRGEVTVTVWEGPSQIDVYRVVSQSTLQDTLDDIELDRRSNS